MYHDKLPDMSAAYAEIQEKAKKKLDPVGKSDGDVDNDGDKDSSDSYLLNRRKVIASKMKKEHHQKDENGKVIEHDDQEEVNEVAPAVAAAGKMALAGAAFAAGEAGAKKIMKKKEKKEVEEAYTVTNADKKGNTPAYQAYKAGKKNVKTGKPLYKAAGHLKLDKAHYDWKEDLHWEAMKRDKLDIKETGVKNKIEINPTVKTEAAKAPVKK